MVKKKNDRCKRWRPFYGEPLDVPIGEKKPTTFLVDVDLFDSDAGIGYLELAALFGVMASSWRHDFVLVESDDDRIADFLKYVATRPADIIHEGVLNIFHDDEFACNVANYINGLARWRNMPDDGNPLNGTVMRWPLTNVTLAVKRPMA